LPFPGGIFRFPISQQQNEKKIRAAGGTKSLPLIFRQIDLGVVF
jgi:hypothetical protein